MDYVGPLSEHIRPCRVMRIIKNLQMNKNSALIWLPKIVEAGLQTPKTVVVEYDHRTVIQIFDGADVPEFTILIENVKAACNRIGYPVFIRTDLSSAKHDGPNAYRIDSDDGIIKALSATLEDNEIKFWLEPNPPKAVLIREWLNLDSPFSAFGGHAIAREWRFFADSEKVRCFHPYWPEDSIQFFGIPEPDGWSDSLKSLHNEPENIKELKQLAVLAAGLYGCYASVDIAMDVTCKWWLTDMATAEDSYHWPSCIA